MTNKTLNLSQKHKINYIFKFWLCPNNYCQGSQNNTGFNWLSLHGQNNNNNNISNTTETLFKISSFVFHRFMLCDSMFSIVTSILFSGGGPYSRAMQRVPDANPSRRRYLVFLYSPCHIYCIKVRVFICSKSAFFHAPPCNKCRGNVIIGPLRIKGLTACDDCIKSPYTTFVSSSEHPTGRPLLVYNDNHCCHKQTLLKGGLSIG